MPRFRVTIAKRVDIMLVQHAAFIANVSKSAAQRFLNEFNGIINRLTDSPEVYQLDTDPNLPEGRYRRAIFMKWYKVVYKICEDTVYIDAIIDIRQDSKYH